MTNETTKNLKVVDNDFVYRAKVYDTLAKQAWIGAQAKDLRAWYFSPDGWLYATPYYYPSIDAAEQALAEWKVQNIPWITPEQVKACASESDLSAVECSIIHWKQIQSAGYRAFEIAVDRKLVGVDAVYCALCRRTEPRAIGHDCRKCVLGPTDMGCNPEWKAAAFATEKTFDSAVSAMVARLEKGKEEVVKKEASDKAKDNPKMVDKCNCTDRPIRSGDVRWYCATACSPRSPRITINDHGTVSHMAMDPGSRVDISDVHTYSTPTANIFDLINQEGPILVGFTVEDVRSLTTCLLLATWSPKLHDRLQNALTRYESAVGKDSK